MGAGFKLQRRRDDSRGTAYYYADFSVWDAARQAWRRVQKSTRCVNEEKALKVAEIMWEAAQATHGGGGVTDMTVDHARRVVSSILTASGLPALVLVVSWSDWEKWFVDRQKGAISPHSAKLYGSMLTRFRRYLAGFVPGGVRVAIGNLTEQHLQGYWDWMRDNERLAFSSAKQSLSIISSALELARESGHCLRNPAKIVQLRGDRTKGVREVFTPADVQALLATAKEDWVTMCLLGLCTGLRLMDCAQLFWEHNITIRGTDMLIRTIPAKTRRSGKLLKIPVVEPLLTHLTAIPSKRRTGFLCPTLSTLSESRVSQQFMDLLSAAGIEKGQMVAGAKRSKPTKSFHSFRHTLNTWMESAGVSQERRMKITGHSSALVNDGYTHVEMVAIGKALSTALLKLKK